MIYRAFQDLQLSNLGLGAMRLPVLDGDDSRIDEAAVFRMVDLAMAGGVNYYDTAWGYHDGHSEVVLGKALARYPRERFFLADKFPGYDLANMGKAEQIFEEQLRRCGVDYFDFYLFHNVCEMNIDAYLDDGKYRTYSFLTAQKRADRKSLAIGIASPDFPPIIHRPQPAVKGTAPLAKTYHAIY